MTSNLRPLRLILPLLTIASLLLAGAAPAPAGARRATTAPAVATARLVVTLAPASAVGALRAEGAAQIAATLSADAGVGLSYVRPFHGGAHIFALDDTRPAAEVTAIMARLAASPEVLSVAPDVPVYPTREPGDPFYDALLWHFKPSGGGSYGANLPPAWDITTGAPSIVTAIIDTGGRLTHEDLAGRTPPGNPGYDLVSDVLKANDGDGRDPDPSDPGDYVLPGEGCAADSSSWHGSHVAGTIGARANNGLGVAGVVWDAPILHVRTLGKCGGWLTDISDGVLWAAGLSVAGLPTNPNPARVLNLSLGGSGACQPYFQSAVTDARGVGAVVVVAAGNQGRDASGSTPANCDGVIVVAATGQSGARASYSNYGGLVTIAAPGGDSNGPDGASGMVYSTIDSGYYGPAGDSYGFYQGTSMATPHVAGIAALMLSANPGLTPDEVLSIIQNTATPFPPGSGCDGVCGAGIINAGAAVEEAARRVRTASFAQAATSAVEGATLTIPVMLSIAGGQSVALPYSLGGTAGSGDSNLVSGSLLFPAGTTSASLSVTLADDSLAETAETLVIALGAGERSSVGAVKAHTITIADNDARAALGLAPTTLALGDQRVGAAGPVKSLTLHSAGDLPLTVSGIVASAGFNRVGGSCPTTTPFTLAAGATCTVGVNLKPALPMEYNGSLTVSSTGGTRMVALSGRGVTPALGFGPTSLSFDGQAVGTTSPTQTVTLTNPGTAPLLVKTITASGDFTLGAGPCAASLPVSLAPGASCKVAVAFAPQAGGAREGALTVTTDVVGGPYGIALTGVGLAPRLALDAASLGFGGQQASTSGAPRTVTLRNVGDATLSLSTISVSGAGFSRAGGSCPTSLPADLAPGGACSVQIRFAPASVGDYAGSLSVEGLGAATVVGLSGVGTAGAAASPVLSPAAVTLGAGVLPAATAAQTITISNAGDAAMTLGAISLSGAGFTQSGGDCAPGLTLAPGASCTTAVSLMGAGAGDYTGSLSIASDAPGGAQVVALTGAVRDSGAFDLANVVVTGTPYTVSLSFDVTRDAPLDGATSAGYMVIADRAVANGDLVVADAAAALGAGVGVRRVTLTIDRLAIYAATHLVVRLDRPVGGVAPVDGTSVVIPAALTRVALPLIMR